MVSSWLQLFMASSFVNTQLITSYLLLKRYIVVCVLITIWILFQDEFCVSNAVFLLLQTARSLEEIRSSFMNEFLTGEGAKRQQLRFCGPKIALSFNFTVAIAIILMNKLVSLVLVFSLKLHTISLFCFLLALVWFSIICKIELQVEKRGENVRSRYRNDNGPKLSPNRFQIWSFP